MAIYFPDGNGGRKVITAADISVAGFSNVSGMTGAITDEDNLLTALAKLSNSSGGGTNTRIQIPVPTQANTLTYDGSVQEPVWLNYSESKMTKLDTGTNSATDAGTYLTYFTLEAGYEWADGTLGDKSVSWQIGRAKIDKIPEQDGTLTYNGETQTPTWRYYDEAKMEIVAGTRNGTRAGTYTVSFRPKDNYAWSDGTTGSKTVTWVIEGVTLAVPSQTNSLTYNGSTQSPTWKDYDITQLLISGTQSAIKAGTYTIMFTPRRNFAWADGTTAGKEVTWTIDKSSAATIILSDTSASLYMPTARAEITIDTTTDVGSVSGATFTATPANTSICDVSISGKKIILTPTGKGTTAVIVAMESTNHTAAAVSITVDANAAPINMLASRTLAQLQTIFRNGQAAQYFKPGDYFNVTFASDIELASSKKIAASSTYRAVLLGADHNSALEGTRRGHFCIGQTTDGKEIYFNQQYMNQGTVLTTSNAGGWASSYMKEWLNDTFYNALPTDLKNVITSCPKYTDNVGGGVNSASSVTSTSQKIWLLAPYEALGTEVSSVNPYEAERQTQYDYYKNFTDYRRSPHNDLTNSGGYWWFRSPCATNTTDFLRATDKKSYGGSHGACGFVPCFTIS